MSFSMTVFFDLPHVPTDGSGRPANGSSNSGQSSIGAGLKFPLPPSLPPREQMKLAVNIELSFDLIESPCDEFE